MRLIVAVSVIGVVQKRNDSTRRRAITKKKYYKTEKSENEALYFLIKTIRHYFRGLYAFLFPLFFPAVDPATSAYAVPSEQHQPPPQPSSTEDGVIFHRRVPDVIYSRAYFIITRASGRIKIMNGASAHPPRVYDFETPIVNVSCWQQKKK